MKKCYYVVLGIIKPASEDEIRKAYKKMALKWHPDKNPDNATVAEEMFKEIGEAYTVLSDKDKKEVYDRYGHEGLTPGQERTPGGRFQPGRFGGFGGFSFTSANDIFNNLFKSGFFGDDDDFFSGHFKTSSKNSKGGNKKDPMASPFGAFGKFGSFDHFGFDDHADDVFSHNSMFKNLDKMDAGGFGSMGRTKSTSTVIKGDKRVITEKTTTITSDGTKTVEIKESISDMNGKNLIEKKYIENGQGQRIEVKGIKH